MSMRSPAHRWTSRCVLLSQHRDDAGFHFTMLCFELDTHGSSWRPTKQADTRCDAFNKLAVCCLRNAKRDSSCSLSVLLRMLGMLYYVLY